MGTSLTGLTPATTYDALIKVGDNGPITASLKTLSDGLGNNLPMEASSSTINFTGTLQQSGTAVPTAAQVNAKQDTLVSGTNIKTINSTSLLGSGNIDVVTSPSGVSGAIQFSNGSAFASDATNLFWDDTNNRLGIGTNAPSVPLEVLGNAWVNAATNADATLSIGNPSRRWDVKALQSGAYYQVVYNNGTIGQSIDYLGNVAFGNVAALSARVGIKGSGSTSATTSLLVQNSASVNSLQLKDNGDLTTYGLINIRSQVGDNGGNIYTAATENLILSSTAYGTGSAVNINTNGVVIQRTGTNSNANISSVLDIRSTTQGFLPPRMTTAQKNAIATPAAGLVVYDSTTNKLCCYNGSTWNDLF